jgi:hypothetical protein
MGSIKQAVQNQKPVQLQVNNSGAWKTVLRFDAADEVKGDKVQRAALMLAEAVPDLRMRIATTDALPIVLMYLTNGEWDK